MRKSIKLTEEHRKNISRGLMGRVVSAETRKKIGLANSIALKGKKLSPERCKQISDRNLRMGIKPPVRTGQKNNKWKGGPEVIRQTKEYKDGLKSRTLKYKYGISLADFNILKEKQNGKCAICHNEDILYVDHCHKSNKVRGLLCQKCNTAIGFFNDDTERMLSAVNYLKP